MIDFLVNYAINNFWCNPTQNNEVIFQLARLTPSTGVLNSVRVLQREIGLPTTGDYYHVFQVGQINPSYIGLITQDPEWSYVNWSAVSTAINGISTFIDVYNSYGMHIPRTEVYYRFTRNRDLIIAIKQNSNIEVKYGTDEIYMRLYKNAYFALTSSQGQALVHYGTTVMSTTDILNIQTMYNTYVAYPGYVFAYVNGYLVDTIDLVTVANGDSVEFIYDPSVKRVLTIPVSQLQVYESVLDNKNKYLLHDSLAENTTINYVDNIEIYIANPWSANRFQSVYYNRNAPDSHRMVTHRDYGIPVSYFVYLAAYFQTISSNLITDTANLNIQVFIRKSGFNHSLVYENNRIEELYKLSDSQIIGAMVGVNSTVSNWQAPVLENSAYTLTMRSSQKNLNDLTVQTALGYNAYSKVIADTPSLVVINSSQLVAPVPLGLQTGYTAYEYNSSGIMLTYGNGEVGDTYNVKNTNTAYVEMMYGSSTNTPSVFYGTASVTLPVKCNYRVYLNYKTTLGTITEPWVDITGSNQYTVSGNTITYTGTQLGQILMVRTDLSLLNYDLNLVPVDGILEFSFTETGLMTGSSSEYIMPVPMADLDIFLNGHSLVEDIDYIVNFPNVVIINRNYLTQPATSTSQYIHVRWNGFCSPSLKYNKAIDTGFIVNNAFSNNYRYDILDDCVNRIIVGGSYLSRTQLGIVDTKAGVAVNSGYNGLPYCIKKPMVPIQNLINTDLLTFIDDSVSIDTNVSNYLSSYLPKLSEPLMSIPQQYAVISPFIVKILNLLINGNIPESETSPTMTDNAVIAICQPYETLLAYDPITKANTIDPRFVVISPSTLNTTVSLVYWQYVFLLRVINLYAKNLVDVSAYITITSV